MMRVNEEDLQVGVLKVGYGKDRTKALMEEAIMLRS